MHALTDQEAERRKRLPIIHPDGEASHLDVRIDLPLAGTSVAGDLVVLYLHGFGSSQEGDKACYFRRRMVAAGLCVASFDFEGHGGSGGSLFDLSLSRNLANIARVHQYLREQGCRRLVLFGSSMGAAAALWYAAEHGAGVVAAVMIAPALDMEAHLCARVGAAGLAQWQRQGRTTLLHQGPSGDPRPIEVGWGLMADLRRYRSARLATRYATPSLIFQGRNDATVSWRAVLDFLEACPFEAIELHLIGDGDHRLLERKDHLWRMARSFLAARHLLPCEPA